MRALEVIRREIGDRMRIARDCDRHQHQQQEKQQRDVRGVDLERAQPQRAPHHRVAARARLVAVDGTNKERREEHEAFGCRYEAERLAGAGTEPRGQMRDRHQDEHQSAQPVEFRLTFHRRSLHKVGEQVRQCPAKRRSLANCYDCYRLFLKTARQRKYAKSGEPGWRRISAFSAVRASAVSSDSIQRTSPPTSAATAAPSRYSTRLPAMAGIFMPGSSVPTTFNGSAPLIDTNFPESGARRVSRSSVTASGSANCSPVMLATNRPPRMSPRASSRRNTRESSRQGGSHDASRSRMRQHTTP